jgi:ABC-type transporter Mla subunit MlaD
VTGLLFVDLRQSNDTREILPPVPSQNYPVINTVQSDFDSFLASLPAIATSVVELLDRAKVIFSGSNTESLAAMVQNLREASDGLPETMRRVDSMLDELKGTGSELRRLAAVLNENAPSMGEKINDLADTLNAAATNLQRVSASADAMLAENRSGIAGFTQDTLPELERTLREARAAAAQFGELSQALSEDPSRLLFQPKQHGFEVPR